MLLKKTNHTSNDGFFTSNLVDPVSSYVTSASFYVESNRSHPWVDDGREECIWDLKGIIPFHSNGGVCFRHGD